MAKFIGADLPMVPKVPAGAPPAPASWPKTWELESEV